VSERLDRDPASVDGASPADEDSHLLTYADRDALATRLAGQFCNRGNLECRWYHGEWELLKALGIVSTSAVHRRQLRALLELALDALPRRPRILLSGSTDDTLLRIVNSAAGGRSVDVVALDLCATPLELMRVYATARTLAYNAVCTNILDYNDADGFDLILTHAFMGNFDDRDRARLVAKWASLLRPGGRVVTIQRIRPVDAPAVVGFSDTQAEVFVQEALRSGARLGIGDLARVERAARAFARNFSTFTITSRAGFEQLFTDAGLGMIHLEYDRLSTVPGLSGPSVPSGGEYALLVAGKNAVTV